MPCLDNSDNQRPGGEIRKMLFSDNILRVSTFKIFTDKYVGVSFS